MGAGKTTLIKKLIKEAYAGEKVVLIENEFGEIGVDGGFLKDAGIEITEMNSGCICCSLVGDFAKALKEVEEKFSPDRIVIEPSGVGKLSDVIRAVQRAGLAHSELNAFCTVVDAKKCKMYLKNFGEFFLDQVENASCIILSHTALPHEKLDEAVALLRGHTQATIVTTEWEKLDGKELLAAMEQRDSLRAELERLAKEAEEHAPPSMMSAAIITTMKKRASAVITTMSTSTANAITIIMRKENAITIIMTKASAAITTTTMNMRASAIITIIMRTKCLQAGARRPPRSFRKRILKARSKRSLRASTATSSAPRAM